jgi:predicted RNase H-like HicB family nuclease
MKHYPALIRKTPDSDYGIEFPDFPGCVTAGLTVGEALTMAEQALALHVDGIRDDGEAIPEPADIEDVLESDEAAGAAAVLIPLARSKGRAVRFNATMDEFLLERVDFVAKDLGMTRSGLLATASRAYIEAQVDPLHVAMDDAVEEGHSPVVGVSRYLADAEKS